MKINSEIYIFGPVTKDPSKSMQLYFKNLIQHLRDKTENVHSAHKANLILNNRGLRFLERRILYPLWILFFRPKADIYHVLDQSYGNLLEFLPAGKRVLTIHDLAFLYSVEKNSNLNPIKLVRANISHGVSLADQVITPSACVKAEILKRFDFKPEQVHVIHNPLKEEFIEQTNEIIKNDLRSLQILHVGSCIERKNIETVIRVFSKMRVPYPNLKFLQVGGTFTKNQLNLINDLGLKDHVKQIHQASLTELIDFYKQSQVLLFPSLLEGFGWPVTEAFSCGTAVVASNRGSLPEIVSNYAECSDPLDEDQLCSSIVKALNFEGIYSLENRIKAQKYASQFTWDNYLNKILEVYGLIDTQMVKAG